MYQFFPLGDAGLLIDFGNEIDESINQHVLSLFEKLQRAHLPWIIDLVPAYSSLAIYYDVFQLEAKYENGVTFYNQAVNQLQEFFLSANKNTTSKSCRKLRIPVCYDKMFAPDLEEVAKLSG